MRLTKAQLGDGPLGKICDEFHVNAIEAYDAENYVPHDCLYVYPSHRFSVRIVMDANGIVLERETDQRPARRLTPDSPEVQILKHGTEWK